MDDCAVGAADRLLHLPAADGVPAQQCTTALPSLITSCHARDIPPPPRKTTKTPPKRTNIQKNVMLAPCPCGAPSARGHGSQGEHAHTPAARRRHRRAPRPALVSAASTPTCCCCFGRASNCGPPYWFARRFFFFFFLWCLILGCGALVRGCML